MRVRVQTGPWRLTKRIALMSAGLLIFTLAALQPAHAVLQEPGPNYSRTVCYVGETPAACGLQDISSGSSDRNFEWNTYYSNWLSGPPPGISLFRGKTWSGTFSSATSAGYWYAVDKINSNNTPVGYMAFTVQATRPPAAQSLTFANPGAKAMSASPIALVITATSGLTPTAVSSTPLVCSVSGLNISTVSVGTCTITASQAGNASYAAAVDVAQSFAITVGSQAALVVAPTSALYGAGLTLSASGGSGTGALTFAVTAAGSANCSVASPSSTALIFTSLGTCAVTATKAADSSYNSVSSIATTITISASPARAPTFSAVTRTVGGFTATITNYDAAFIWGASVPGGSAVINPATSELTITGLANGASATATVTATRTGYTNGSSTLIGTAIAAPVISSAATASGTVGSVLVTYAITGSNTPTSFNATGLPAGLSVNPSTGEISGTPEAAGIFTVTISAANAATTGSATLTITIAKATPVITWATPASVVYGTALSATQLNATATVGVRVIPGVFTYMQPLGTLLALGSTTLGVGYVPSDTANYNSVSSTTVNQLVTSIAARTPEFGSVTATVGGFTALITNYDPGFIWSVVATSGSASVDSVTGLLTVSGLATGASSIVTVSTTRTGYTNGSAPITGLAMAAPVISSAVTAGGAVSSVFAGYTITGSNTPTSFNATGLPAGLSVNPSTGEISGTPEAAGIFTVTISAANAATTGSATLTITIAKATPVITWATPASVVYGTALSATQLNATAAKGAASIPGVFTYSTGIGTILPVGANSLSVDFVPADFSNYNSVISTSVSQLVTLAPQVITWAPVRSVLTNASPILFAPATSNGPGLVTYSVTTPGSAHCSIVLDTAPAMTFTSIGTCTVTATAAATATHAVSTSSKVFTVTDPPVVNSGGTDGTSEAAPAVASPVNAVSPLNFANTGIPGTASALAGDGTKPVAGIGLPPAPVGVRVLPDAQARTAKVIAKLPMRTSGAEVVSTVVEVRDKFGKLVARVVVAVKSTETEVSVTVPYAAEGYSVKVYNVNSVGVSQGADTASGLVHASTITSRTANGTPALFGTSVATPIYFTAASAVLDATDKKMLDAAAAKVMNTTKRLFITGFARLGGGAESELAAISTARAKNVATYLAGKGVRVWIRYYGVGALQGTGQWQDRRVEIRASDLAIPRSMAH